jgi:hypothetical protein
MRYHNQRVLKKQPLSSRRYSAIPCLFGFEPRHPRHFRPLVSNNYSTIRRRTSPTKATATRNRHLGRLNRPEFETCPRRGAKYHFWPFPPFPLPPAAVPTRPQPPIRQRGSEQESVKAPVFRYFATWAPFGKLWRLLTDNEFTKILGWPGSGHFPLKLAARIHHDLRNI